MEIEFIEDKKSVIVFKLKGATHTILNALKDALTRDSSVKLATYRIDHPLIGTPQFRVEAEDPRKAVQKALKSLQKEFSFKI